VRDTIPPVLVGLPANATVQCLGDVLMQTGVTATDNCGAVSPTLTQTTNGSCPMIITRTWTAVDACTNTATATRTVTVRDTIPPVLVGLPANVTVQCVSDVTSPPTVTATDNCGAVSPTLTQTTNGSCPTIITRTWTAVDACTNTTTATRTVTVQDTVPPVLVGLPANVTVQCVSDVTSPPTVTATDHCGPVSPTLTQTTNGSCPMIITRTWTAVDACTNTTSATSTVTVRDTIPPVLVGLPANVTVQCVSDVTMPTGVTATDHCGPVSPTLTQTTNGSCR